ncbi:hypothetical protein CCMSSC00406_0007694 [Pleurotus cornucopiae]|uniref:Uncharacterized protein n=1 Tax=Pleurotus cornucopiae TaxID=5321 RepID=A0ACB7J068_PLECO|nr:hypothetical protein CCMSSC00406_0007694 [Pleurotus cornucopiae]
MGGFVTHLGQDSGTTRSVNLNDVSFTHANFWPNVNVAEIKDKSNSDSFTKTFVVWQTMWFVIQLATRVVEGLAVTELEIMTLAYAILCALLYGLWWNKPYDVQTPIDVTPKQPMSVIAPPVSPEQFQRGGLPLFASAATPVLSNSESSATAESQPNPRQKSVFHHVLSEDWIMLLDKIIFGGTDSSKRGTDDDFSERKLEPSERAVVRVLFIASATIFGAIHCIPWNFQFPTTLERVLWISSASFIAVAPLILGIMSAVTSQLLSHKDLRGKLVLNSRRIVIVMVTRMLQFIHLILVVTYCLARFVSIIQAFVLLRDLPPSAVQSITWSRLIPHI